MQCMHISVVIVGAGPTGLTAANLLGRAGIETLVLERNANLSNTPRAITIDDEGLRICQALGLLDAVIRHTWLDIQAHYVSRGRYLARVAPTSNSNGYPMISTLHQPFFETALLTGLERFPCVMIRFQQTVETCTQDEHKVYLWVRTANGDRLTISCDYLLACDGGRSIVRQELHISMRSSRLFSRKMDGVLRQHTIDREQRWLVVDCVNDDDSSAAAVFFCNPERPSVTVPAPHRRRRWEFMLLPGEREEDLISSDAIVALIAQARATLSRDIGNSKEVKQPQIVRSTVYTFHAALATEFVKGRAFLLGDAAHLMPPFGGQGMNSGLCDAYNLCWKLRLVLHGLARPCLLVSYQQERASYLSKAILFFCNIG